MATKKTGGSTSNGRDSAGRRLGLKKFGGENVIPGNIIVRQRGTSFHPGRGVGIGTDHTIYAMIQGSVYFGIIRGKRYVNVKAVANQFLAPIQVVAQEAPPEAQG